MRSSVELNSPASCGVRFDEIGGEGPYTVRVRGAGGAVDLLVDGKLSQRCPETEASCSYTVAGQSRVELAAEHPEELELRGWQPAEPCGIGEFALTGDVECTAIWDPAPPSRRTGSWRTRRTPAPL